MKMSSLSIFQFPFILLVALFSVCTISAAENSADSDCTVVCFRLQNLPNLGSKGERPLAPLKSACNLLFQGKLTNSECPLHSANVGEAVIALKSRGQQKLAEMLARYDSSENSRSYGGQPYCSGPGMPAQPFPAYPPQQVHYPPSMAGGGGGHHYPSPQIEEDLTCDEAYSQLQSLKTAFNYDLATVNQQRSVVCTAVQTAVSMLINCDQMLWQLQQVSGYLKRRKLDSLGEIVNAYREPAKFRRLCR